MMPAKKDDSFPRVEELPVVPNLGRILAELGEELRSIYPQVVTASIVATVDDGRMVMLPVP
jgi:hypothetical protein